MGEVYYMSGKKHELFCDHQDLVHRTPWWGVSIIFHAAVLAFAMMIIVAEVLPDSVKDRVIIFDPEPRNKQEYEPHTVRKLPEKKIKIIDSEVKKDKAVIDKSDIEISTEITTPEKMKKNSARGTEGVNMLNLNSRNAFFQVFGIGPGGANPFGRPDGGDDDYRKIIGDPDFIIAQPGVDRALEWFKRHQAADGSWSFDEYWKECKDVPACAHKNLEGNYNKWENAATGFALLCYLGRGYTHKVGKYRPQVINGLALLKDNQNADGSFSSNNYVHAVATMAVAEAFGMTGSLELEEMAQKAVDIICARQNEDGYMGWDYSGPSTRSDTSVTGWQVMALKSAKIAGLGIGNSFDGAAAFLEKVTPNIEGDSYHPVMEHVHYIYKADTGDKGHQNSRLTAIGLLCRVFMGQRAESMVLRAHAEKLMKSLPDPADGQFYEWYYATLAMFQMSGTYWDTYKKALLKTLCDTQRAGGCADGSWDPPDSSCHGARKGGRLFCTAVGCLSLQVPYRYDKVEKK